MVGTERDRKFRQDLKSQEEAFDQKLQSIDLNLDTSATEPKPAAAPEKKVQLFYPDMGKP